MFELENRQNLETSSKTLTENASLSDFPLLLQPKIPCLLDAASGPCRQAALLDEATKALKQRANAAAPLGMATPKPASKVLELGI